MKKTILLLPLYAVIWLLILVAWPYVVAEAWLERWRMDKKMRRFCSQQYKP